MHCMTDKGRSGWKAKKEKDSACRLSFHGIIRRNFLIFVKKYKTVAKEKKFDRILPKSGRMFLEHSSAFFIMEFRKGR